MDSDASVIDGKLQSKNDLSTGVSAYVLHASDASFKNCAYHSVLV